MRAASRTALIIAASLASSATAAEPRIDGETQKATGRALDWLAARQNADGSWSDSKYPHDTAITSFALLAFLSQGHLPGEGLYGPEVAKGCRFLLSSARADQGGFLVGSRGGNMYNHAMATLALTQLWGMVDDAPIRPTLVGAVDLIVRCQGSEGGWRYDPKPSGSDISATIMQVMALRAAKNSGLHVPDVTLKRAIGYIQRCHDEPSGGFSYQPGIRGANFARTAAGVCVLQLAGQYDSREIPRAVAFLKSHFQEDEYFWYGHYYAAHAMHQRGGDDWRDWYDRIRGLLLANQSPEGDWSRADLDSKSAGTTYQTAIAVIILSVPAQYLPLFQS